MISFLAGKPNPNTFPFESISVKLKPHGGSSKQETLTIEADELVDGCALYNPLLLQTQLILACSDRTAFNMVRQPVLLVSCTGSRSCRRSFTAARRTAGA